jgi:hypothetical protein
MEALKGKYVVDKTGDMKSMSMVGEFFGQLLSICTSRQSWIT